MHKEAARKKPSLPNAAISYVLLVPITTSVNPQKHTTIAFDNLQGMSSNNPNKLMMLSNSAGINEDLLLSLNNYNDPSDGRQHSFNQSDDNSEDSDYMRDSAEQDGKSESADSLVFEDGIDAEQIVDTPDV